jgi:phosphotransferase system enzyme I (PtsP)
MVVADNPELLQVPDGTLLLLDGEAGTIHVAPGEEIVSHFRRREAAAAAVAPVKGRMAPETRTRDGHRIRLMANINLLSELPLAIDLLAEGIGLYRTEFPFLVRSAFPTEEEQRVVYARLIEAMVGKPVTFRTLDVGGDKILPYLTRRKEPNPELGLRAIRFSLRHQDLFIQQLRAILQAGVHAARLKLMFPMIGSLDEFHQARRLLDEAKAQLAAEGRPHNDTLQVGIMVELPSAVEMIAPLTEEADFLSIGTNDLLQYLLAVDRGNDNVAEYYTTAHPAMLRALRRIVRAAVDRRKEVTVCGELGRQPEMILFLIGVGLRSFSVDPMFLPSTQRIIATIDSETAARFAAAALAETTIEGVRRVMAGATAKWQHP